MQNPRKKGKRVKTIDAYLCRKFQLKIVQKIRFCSEVAPDLCDGCPFREPLKEIAQSPTTKLRV